MVVETFLAGGMRVDPAEKLVGLAAAFPHAVVRLARETTKLFALDRDRYVAKPLPLTLLCFAELPVDSCVYLSFFD